RFAACGSTTGANAVPATAIQTHGTHSTTNTGITVSGAVTLQADTDIDTHAVPTRRSSDLTIDGANALTLAAGTGNIDLQGVVGGTPLTSLTVSGAATARIGADVRTTGAQAVTATTIQTNGTDSTTNTGITFSGAVTLQADT